MSVNWDCIVENCSESFSTRNQLRIHLNKQHKILQKDSLKILNCMSSELTKQKTFKCLECPKAFKCASSLNYHWRVKHCPKNVSVPVDSIPSDPEYDNLTIDVVLPADNDNYGEKQKLVESNQKHADCRFDEDIADPINSSLRDGNESNYEVEISYDYQEDENDSNNGKADQQNDIDSEAEIPDANQGNGNVKTDQQNDIDSEAEISYDYQEDGNVKTDQQNDIDSEAELESGNKILNDNKTDDCPKDHEHINLNSINIVPHNNNVMNEDKLYVSKAWCTHVEKLLETVSQQSELLCLDMKEVKTDQFKSLKMLVKIKDYTAKRLRATDKEFGELWPVKTHDELYATEAVLSADKNEIRKKMVNHALMKVGSIIKSETGRKMIKLFFTDTFLLANLFSYEDLAKTDILALFTDIWDEMLDTQKLGLVLEKELRNGIKAAKHRNREKIRRQNQNEYSASLSKSSITSSLPTFARKKSSAPTRSRIPDQQRPNIPPSKVDTIRKSLTPTRLPIAHEKYVTPKIVHARQLCNISARTPSSPPLLDPKTWLTSTLVNNGISHISQKSRSTFQDLTNKYSDLKITIRPTQKSAVSIPKRRASPLDAQLTKQQKLLDHRQKSQAALLAVNGGMTNKQQ